MFNSDQSFFRLTMQTWQNGFSQAWEYVRAPIQIGNFHISIFQILSGLLVFVITIILARTISSFVEKRIAKRTQIDPGLRYTIARLINYLIIVLGLLSALKAIGVDLTSIAVIFTALSVGIGFGLQYIAADIASGFILLFERPIRVGDRITIEDGEEGDVQSIKLRTTVLYTNDRVAIIVPNSKLVSQRVINWSYGGPRARIAIPVGVSYSSDIDLVTETLLEAAEGVKLVTDDPPPKVQFLNFADFALEFRLLVWTPEPNRQVQIRSDINYRIAQLFRERNIEIPFPIQELRVKQPEGKAVVDGMGEDEKVSDRD